MFGKSYTSYGRRRFRLDDRMIFIIGTSLFGLLCVGAVASWLNYVPVDRQGCSAETPAVAVILMDTTSEISPITANNIKAELQTIIESLPRYTRIKIFSVRPGENGGIAAHFDRCLPYIPSKETDRLSEIFENRKRILLRWRNSFLEPMKETLSTIVSQDPYHQSPILEAIQSISVSEFRNRWRDVPQKELIIVSDMLQNSNLISHYRWSKQYKKSIETGLTDLRKKGLDPQLSDIHVRIIYLERLKEKQMDEHFDWWKRIIRESNGHIDENDIIRYWAD